MGAHPGSVEQIRTICFDLDNLRRFADGIENSLRFEVRQTQQPSAADEGLWRLTETLPWLYRGAALLTILGFLEHNLNAVCETLRREHDCETAITDLPGKGLRRSKHYLRKHIGIDFPAHSRAWNRLLKYADIRNLIAHRDGLIKDDDPELLRFIDTEPRLTVDAGRVRLHEGAPGELIGHVQEFFEQLAGAVDEAAPR